MLRVQVTDLLFSRLDSLKYELVEVVIESVMSQQVN